MTEPETLNPASILDSTKKALQVPFDYDVFDMDIIMHIISAFFTLQQIGIGPADGFQITGSEETWDTYLGTDLNLNAVKSYIFLKTRLLFDPPDRSYVLEAMKEQVTEYEWRLNLYREGKIWNTVTVMPE